MALKKMAPMDINDEVPMLQAKLTDNLFLKTGIELEDLIRDSEILKLEDDEEYQEMSKEYGEKIEQHQQT